MKAKTSLLFAVALIGLTLTGLHAQIAINNTAANPDPSAILDLKSGNAGVNKGFLPQSVALTNVTVAAPVTSPATGLIVYSSTTPAGGNGIGYYYWTGTAWAYMGSSISGAGTAGQVTYWGAANTIKGDTNLYYDNVNHRLGIYTSHPFEPLDINLSNGATTAKFGFAQPICLVANSPMVGFNAYWNSGLNYYTSNYAGMIEFNQNIAGGFQFMTAPSGIAFTAATMTPAMTILNNGNVGIGIIAPTACLHVSSATSSYAGEFDNTAANGTSVLVNATGNISYGLVASGTFEGVQSICPTANASYALVGANTAASGTSDGMGTWGQTSQSKGFGVEGINYYTTAGVGVGVYGAGSGALGTVPYSGEGVFGEAKGFTGIWGRSDLTSGNAAGGYFDNNVAGYNSDYDYVSYYYSGTQYKIIGTGSVSTVVKDNNNVRRVMACPEAPEILFEDYGTATLSGGKVHIDLDPTYAKNVTINQKHPLRVLITLNDQCNGVYVTNRTATGFDVVELNNGASNASFTYEVIANRADDYDANGNLISKYADNRFVVGPGPAGGDNTSASSGTPQAPTNIKNPAVAPVVPVAPARGNIQGTTAAATTPNQK